MVDYLLQEQLELFIELLLSQSARHPAEASHWNLGLVLDGTGSGRFWCVATTDER